MLDANRIQTTASALQGDLMFARTEALKRGIWVTACPSTDQVNCSGANAWEAGWIVFFDKTGNGVYDPSVGDQILKVRARPPARSPSSRRRCRRRPRRAR